MLKINLQTHVIVVLRCVLEERTILALQDVVDAIPHELIPAADVHGEYEGGLAIGSGEVETNAIEVHKLDIEAGRPA